MAISRKERGTFLKSKLDELATNLIQDEDKLKAFVQSWTQGFYQYSMNNTLLVFSQNPDATLLAGYKTWVNKYNRRVRKGEKAIWVLAPRLWKKKVINDAGKEEEVSRMYFNPVPIFDVSQTDGEPIEVGNPDLVEGVVDLNEFIKISKAEVIIKDNGQSNGVTDGKTIWLTPKKNEASMVATFIHEEAHVRLNHVGNDVIARSTKEIEAEAVGFIVGAFFGIKNERSKYYVGNWSEGSDGLVVDAKKILSVAESIIKDALPVVKQDK